MDMSQVRGTDMSLLSFPLSHAQNVFFAEQLVIVASNQPLSRISGFTLLLSTPYDSTSIFSCDFLAVFYHFIGLFCLLPLPVPCHAFM